MSTQQIENSMKKISFFLLTLLTGTAFAQSSASADAAVNAEIVSPISITNVSALNFGRIIGTTAGGDVTIAATSAGTRTSTATDLLAPSGTVNAAKFQVTASDSYTYKITIPDIDLTGATTSETMGVTFTNSLGSTGLTGTGSAEDLYLGGTLTVGANQSEDTYSGTVTVTVAYE